MARGRKEVVGPRAAACPVRMLPEDGADSQSENRAEGTFWQFEWLFN